jgi:hypothetical protein
MRYFALMDRRAIGSGFASFLVLYLLGLLVVGGNASDTEMQLAFWPAFGVGLAVSMRVLLKSPPAEDK